MPKLTEPTLRQYRAGPQRREIRDSQAPGLYLVIQPKPSRTISWALRFRRPDGRAAKLTLGTVDLSAEPSDAPVIGGALTLGQARELAAKLDRERKRGIDVIEQRKADVRRQKAVAGQRTANSFGAVAREFFVDHRTKRHIRPRHWRADARLLGLVYPRDCNPTQTEPSVLAASLAERWGNKLVTEIDAHDIHTVVDEARRLGIPGLPRHNGGISEARGRKMHAALSGLFRWAVQQRKVAVNPCVGVWHPGAPPARERVLSEFEVRLFWKACDRIGAPYGPLFQLLLLTGQRLGEVAGMRRAELSEDGATWTIPGERTKNHRVHVVPLPPTTRRLMAGLPRIQDRTGHVFTIGGGKLTGFSNAKAQLDETMAAIARAEVRGQSTEAWRLHDLRRTCATGMAELGIAPHIVEAVLNHVSGTKAGVAGIYNRAAYGPEKELALARWAAHLEGLVSERPANVVF